MRSPRIVVTAALACLPLLSGCMTGHIYQHTFEPLSTNFDRTPACTGTGQSDIDHLHIPLSSIDIDVLWDSNAIADAAKQGGIEEICYADFEEFSILGVWNEYTVHVYGHPAAK